jgi:hypothetical protein
MLLPLSEEPITLASHAPSEIKAQAKWWWCLTILLFAMMMARVVAQDVFGAIISGMMGRVCFFMVKDECANLTMCLPMFGLLCIFNAFFETIPLLQLATGRTFQKQTMQALLPGQLHDQQSYLVTIETHPFFDHSMPWRYNWQSATMIASPLTFLIGAFLSYRAYNILQTISDPVSNPLGRVLNASNNFGATAQATGTSNGAALNQPQRGFKEFSGQAHKLV